MTQLGYDGRTGLKLQSQSLGQAWRVLHVVSNHEKRVAMHLEYRGVEHFLPTYREQSRWTDRTVSLDKPLFPGYLFVRFAQHSRLAALSTPGVLEIVGSEMMGMVPNVEIARIRAAIDKGYHLRPHSFFRVGMQVKIRRGIFQGAEGTVTELRKQCMVVLALSGTGHCFSCAVNEADIEIPNCGSPFLQPAVEVVPVGRIARVCRA